MRCRVCQHPAHTTAACQYQYSALDGGEICGHPEHRCRLCHHVEHAACCRRPSDNPQRHCRRFCAPCREAWMVELESLAAEYMRRGFRVPDRITRALARSRTPR